MRTFLRTRARDDAGFMSMLIRQQYPERTEREVSVLVKEEMARETEFRRRMIERVENDLPDALQESDPQVRAARVQKILDREKRYLKQRQAAMNDRTVAAEERRIVKEASPEGGYWKLSSFVKEHTVDCLMMGEKFWPWEVLDVFHPPTHHGCACELYTHAEAQERGLMGPELPDKADAIKRAQKVIEQFGHIQEGLGLDTVHAYVEALQLEERRDPKRIPRGFEGGGRFAPKNPLLTALRHLLPHTEPPSHARRKGKGRWAGVEGRMVFVPEQRPMRRQFDGHVYTSPPQSTNVYRDGKLFDQPGDRKPVGKPVGKLAVPATADVPEAVQADVEAIRASEHQRSTDQVQRALAERSGEVAPVFDGQMGVEALEALEAHGFHEVEVRESAAGITVELSHPDGHRLAAVFDPATGHVSGSRWLPSQRGPRAVPGPLDHPPASTDEFLGSVDAWVRRHAAENGHAPLLGEVRVSGDHPDHAGEHFWNGDLALGEDVETAIEEAAAARAAGIPLTDDQLHSLYAAYRVAYHEGGHAANPISQDEYYNSPGGQALEEMLAEEATRIHAARALHEQGQDEVLAWAADNPWHYDTLGTYHNFRQGMDELLNRGQVPPELREQLLLDLKDRVHPEERWGALGDTLHTWNPAVFPDRDTAALEAANAMHDAGEASQNTPGGFAPLLTGELPHGVQQTVNVANGTVQLGSTVMVATRVIDRAATDNTGKPTFKTVRKTGTVTDLSIPTAGGPVMASVAFDGGGSRNALLLNEILQVVGRDPELLVGDHHVQPGDVVSWPRTDGHRTDARVDRVLRAGDHWALEATTLPGEHALRADQRVVLTAGRTNGQLTVDRPVQTPSVPGDGDTTPEMPPVGAHVPDKGVETGSADEPSPVVPVSTRADREARRVAREVDGWIGKRWEHVQANGADEWDVGQLEGLGLGREIVLAGGTDRDLLRAALLRGPKYGGDDRNEGFQSGMRTTAVLTQQHAPLLRAGKASPPLRTGTEDGKLSPSADGGVSKMLAALGIKKKKADVFDPQKAKPGQWVADKDGKQFRVMAVDGTGDEVEQLTLRGGGQEFDWHVNDLPDMTFLGSLKKGGKSEPTTKKYEKAAAQKTDDGTVGFVKAAGGSNGAWFGEDADGNRWIVKAYKGNQDRVATELLANAVYREMGIAVPEAGQKLVQGKPALAYPIVAGQPGGGSLKVKAPSVALGRGFMTDALLANWDVVGLDHDNLLWPKGTTKVTGDLEPVRLDQGGSLFFRAMGSKKDYGVVPAEVWTMLQPSGQGFGTMDVPLEEQRVQAAKIAATLTDARIDALVDDAPFADLKMKEDARVVLKARVAWMAMYAVGTVGPPKPLEEKDARDELSQLHAGMHLETEEHAALQRFLEAPGEFNDLGHTWLPGKESAADIGGPPFEPVEELPDTEDAQVAPGPGPTFDEAMEGYHGYQRPKISAGVVVTEPDGRVWTFEPKGHYGGVERSLSKGRVDEGQSEQQAALRELWEETGLTGKITGDVGWYAGSVTLTHYFTAERTGGAPWANDGKETAAVYLQNPSVSAQRLAKRDVRVLKDVGALPESSPVGALDRLLKDAKTKAELAVYVPLPDDSGDLSAFIGNTYSDRRYFTGTTSLKAARKGKAYMRVLVPSQSRLLYLRGVPGFEDAKGPELIGPRDHRLRVVGHSVVDGRQVLDTVLLPTHGGWGKMSPAAGKASPVAGVERSAGARELERILAPHVSGESINVVWNEEQQNWDLKPKEEWRQIQPDEPHVFQDKWPEHYVPWTERFGPKVPATVDTSPPNPKVGGLSKAVKLWIVGKGRETREGRPFPWFREMRAAYARLEGVDAPAEVSSGSQHPKGPPLQHEVDEAAAALRAGIKAAAPAQPGLWRGVGGDAWAEMIEASEPGDVLRTLPASYSRDPHSAMSYGKTLMYVLPGARGVADKARNLSDDEVLSAGDFEVVANEPVEIPYRRFGGAGADPGRVVTVRQVVRSGKASPVAGGRVVAEWDAPGWEAVSPPELLEAWSAADQAKHPRRRGGAKGGGQFSRKMFAPLPPQSHPVPDYEPEPAPEAAKPKREPQPQRPKVKKHKAGQRQKDRPVQEPKRAAAVPAGKASPAAGGVETVEPQGWLAPPPPVGVKGETRGGKGYSSDEAYGTNTKLGQAGEEAFLRILGGGEVLHPEGKGAQSPLDIRFDGYGFEVKAVSTKTLGYKATPKGHEIEEKQAHADELGVKSALAMVVVDSDSGQAHGYFRDGLRGGRLSENTGWQYLGSTPLDAEPGTGREHPLGPKAAALEQRVERSVAGAGKLSPAEAHFNAAGKVSQRTLGEYATRAATKPTTFARYSKAASVAQPSPQAGQPPGELGVGGRVWDPARRALHERIIGAYLKKRKVVDGAEVLDYSEGAEDLQPDPGGPRVLFSGGGYAAGKGSVLKILAERGEFPPGSFKLDPDQVKAELPEFQDMIGNDPEANLHVYQESWAIAQEIQARAQERGLSMVVDGISDTSPDEMIERAMSFTDRGYAAQAVYVDIPTDEAIRRANYRAANAKDDSDRRMIPEVVMRAVHRDVAATLPAMLDTLPGLYDEVPLDVQVWNNHQGLGADGKPNPPKQVVEFRGGEEMSVLDPELWEQLRAKSQESILGVEEAAGDDEDDLVAPDDYEGGGMTEQEIRDAGLAIDVPFETGDGSERLRYADDGD